ncbi:hypothetical protein [Rhizobium sp. BG4]|uniref:hypothetical protein n=1 Tax=Rhizobium sp. BG4 TaxID=2613770 RepID=UPI00193D2F8F|nr:hypothetical protein [Rhizobium sp. BG4]QRM42359.1 hypothetical protein F2982_02330 [Rhizobium sp. BG4]
MASNFERYEKDIERLGKFGAKLTMSLQKLTRPKDPVIHDFAPEEVENLPDFGANYQAWYSESLALVKQLIPEREDDFRSYYQHKGQRSTIMWANYTISDALRGVQTHAGVTPAAAIPAMFQQFNIINGLRNRFRSSLYDIRTLVHADVLDDELHAAEVLNTSGFVRGAGAVAGVVLEGHLGAVCARHGLAIKKKHPTISDFYQALKDASVIDLVQWRFIQHLADIRNKCDHKAPTDPTATEVAELIEGVRKITKTVM